MKYDPSNYPMFFGPEVELQRYDIQKHEIFEKLTEKMLSTFWRPEEVDLNKDRLDFKKLSESEQHIFVSNIKYQITLDTLQGVEPLVAFLPYCSLPELQVAITCWGFDETIHSRSYTHILRNVFADPSAIFDEILEDEHISKRADMTRALYSQFKKEPNMDNLYLVMNAVNILEGVQFFTSFACSFAFAERKLMEGNAKTIKFIARDEANHLTLTQNIIKLMRKEDPTLQKRHEVKVYDMFFTAAEDEADWADYLFKDGAMLGLNAEILKSYTQYITNNRLRALGMNAIFPVTKNPLPWTRNWLNSDEVQVAPQEVELSSYLTDQIDNDVNLKGLSL